jgi:uncharacterized membrane protein YhaH (DUF805 family)
MNQITAKPPLEFVEALSASMEKILQFKGRSRRSEYWWTMLAVILACFIVPPIGWLMRLATIPLTFRRLHDSGRSGWWWGVGFILSIVLFSNIVYDLLTAYLNEGMGDAFPTFLVVKYLGLIGIVSLYKIIMLVLMCIDSQVGFNKYGDSPKYPEADNRPL